MVIRVWLFELLFNAIIVVIYWFIYAVSYVTMPTNTKMLLYYLSKHSGHRLLYFRPLFGMVFPPTFVLCRMTFPAL